MLSTRNRRWTQYGAVVCLGLGGLMLLPGDRAQLSATEVEEPANVAAQPSAPLKLTEQRSTALMASTSKTASLPAPLPEPTVARTVPKQAAVQPASVGRQPAPAADPVANGTPVGSETAQVGASAVNLRSAPSTSSAVDSVLRAGEQVSIVETQRNWSRVLTASGQTGWVYSAYLNSTSGAEPASLQALASPPKSSAAPAKQVTKAQSAAGSPEPTASPAKKREKVQSAAASAEPSADAVEQRAKPQTVRVSHRVAVLASPSGSAQPLFSLKAGQRVSVLESRGPWLRVAVNGGPSGWILTR